jgi:hypothetical protein
MRTPCLLEWRGSFRHCREALDSGGEAAAAGHVRCQDPRHFQRLHARPNIARPDGPVNDHHVGCVLFLWWQRVARTACGDVPPSCDGRPRRPPPSHFSSAVTAAGFPSKYMTRLPYHVRGMATAIPGSIGSRLPGGHNGAASPLRSPAYSGVVRDLAGRPTTRRGTARPAAVLASLPSARKNTDIRRTRAFSSSPPGGRSRGSPGPMWRCSARYASQRGASRRAADACGGGCRTVASGPSGPALVEVDARTDAGRGAFSGAAGN